jgi:hypothetical protein
MILNGRALHPVVCPAFKAVELLLKWLVGSTPTSSAIYFFKYLFLKGFYFGYFLSLTLGLTALPRAIPSKKNTLHF